MNKTLKNFIAFCEKENKQIIGQIVDSLFTTPIVGADPSIGESEMQPFFRRWEDFEKLREIEKEFVVEEDHGRFSYIEMPDLIYASNPDDVFALLQNFAKKDRCGVIEYVRSLVDSRYPQFNNTLYEQSLLIDSIAEVLYEPTLDDYMYIYTAIAEFVMREIFKVYDRFLES